MSVKHPVHATRIEKGRVIILLACLAPSSPFWSKSFLKVPLSTHLLNDESAKYWSLIASCVYAEGEEAVFMRV